MKKRNEIIKELRCICLCCVIVFGLMSIVGCGGNDGDSVQSLTITGKSGNQVNLNGSWSEGCIPDVGEGESEKFVITISGSSFSGTGNIWIYSTDCSGTPDMTMNMSGTFTLGGEVTSTLSGSPVTATEIDMVNSTAQATVYDADMITYMNSEGFCGFTDWEVGVPKDILGTVCWPDQEKDIIYIDDTVDPDLMYGGIGEEDGGTLDANGYPTEIDADSPEARM